MTVAERRAAMNAVRALRLAATCLHEEVEAAGPEGRRHPTIKRHDRAARRALSNANRLQAAVIGAT